jgi:MFS transporter, MCT family, solute carrier family 16 (monocarboxylic acid transporters), member 14
LIENYKWQGTLLVISGITFFCAVFGYMFRPLNLEEYETEQAPNEKCQISYPNGNNNNNNNDVKYKTPESINLLTPNGHQQMIRSHSFGNGALNGNIDKNGEEKNRLAMSVSQPLLIAVDRKSLKSACSGTLDRPDAFYTGSLHNITRSHHSIHHAEFDRYGSLKRRSNNEEVDDRNQICGCIPCSKETQDTIQKMMSFEILKDPIFILFVVSNFLTR